MSKLIELIELLKKLDDLNYIIEVSTALNESEQLVVRVDTYKYYPQTESKIYKRAYIGKENEKLEDLLMRVLQSVVVK